MEGDNRTRRQIDAIVGAALKALVESGADDEFIGAFAENHRTKIAHILGITEAQNALPDLESIIAAAVTNALATAGLDNQRKSRAKTKRVNVSIAGKRTSVTVNTQILSKLIESKGAKQAIKIIEELSNSAPQQPGRSKWVMQRLESILAFAPAGSAAVGVSRH